MTNFEKLKNMTQEQFAEEFIIFRPSDLCFDDENRNYFALDGSRHQYLQDCFQANVKWLNEESPKDPQDYIKELEAKIKQLKSERDKAVSILDSIDSWPALAIDAAPVVRCGECRYWDEDGRCNPPKNGLIREYTEPNDFCSYGERRDAET